MPPRPCRTSFATLALAMSWLPCGCPTPRQPDRGQGAADRRGAETAGGEASPAPSPRGLGGPAAGETTSAAVGPPGPPRTPHPDEGRNQLDLLPLRPIRVGGVPVQVWVADTYERRRLGLMHVRALPDDRGMLFVYPDVDRRAFWMQNTLIPLSLAYVGADGRIHEVVHMKALDESTYPSRQAARFGLEMRRGWFDDHGVRPGAQIEGITQLVGYP